MVLWKLSAVSKSNFMYIVNINCKVAPEDCSVSTVLHFAFLHCVVAFCCTLLLQWLTSWGWFCTPSKYEQADEMISWKAEQMRGAFETINLVDRSWEDDPKQTCRCLNDPKLNRWDWEWVHSLTDKLDNCQCKFRDVPIVDNGDPLKMEPVSYTHLTLPTNREV